MKQQKQQMKSKAPNHAAYRAWKADHNEAQRHGSEPPGSSLRGKQAPVFTTCEIGGSLLVPIRSANFF